MSRLRAAIPARVQFFLASMLGEHIQDWVVNRALTGGLDWERTPAFRFASGGEGYLRLNIKGRERTGCLERAEVADYIAWLKARLCEIRVAGSGAPFVSDVFSAHDLSPGERTDYLPDLILQYAPEAPVAAIESPAIGMLEAHLGTGRGGNHCGDAFMIVAGLGASPAALGEVNDIRDIRTFIESILLDGGVGAPAMRRGAAPAFADS
jgi:predicted AlkP superfamily phosphohydrolase/phosphomutase